MLRLSKLADYGTLIMTALAREPERLRAAADLSEATHVPLPTVSKLLKGLTRAGLLESIRGNHGGYRLVRAPEQISVAEIIEILDGPIALTECGSGESACLISGSCTQRNNWNRISGAIRTALDELTLADMAQPQPVDLHRIETAELRP